MKTIPKEIINEILDIQIESIGQALDYFSRNKELFLPQSQAKLQAIVQEKSKYEKLIIRIISHDYFRPAIIIQDGSFKLSPENPWEPILSACKKPLETVIKSVGIFEIIKRGKKFPSGTGWVLSDDLIVTNQHVAQVFCKKIKGKYYIKKGFEKITIDFKEEFDRIHDNEFKVLEVIHMEDDDTSLYDHVPDIAILRVEKVNANGEKLPPPLKVYTGPIKSDQLIAIVGFPSADYKLPNARKKIFKNIYDVKRLQPGLVKDINMLYTFDFKHDCSTLTGNSGSPVIDLETGHVIGTHFAGSINVFEGYAVRADVIKEIIHNYAFCNVELK